MTKDLRDPAERIAELEAANQELRSTGEWYRSAITSAEVGTWVWDLRTTILTWSDQCKVLFGLLPSSPVDYSIFLDRLHPEDRDRVDSAVQTAIRDRADYDTQSRVVWPDGTEHWLRFKG